MPGHSATGDVIDASDRFLRRAMRLAPSADPWSDAIAETVMHHWPDAPDSVVEAFSVFASNYADQTERQNPDDMDWLWQHFMRLAEEGTPERRQIAAAREYMLMAKTRLVTLQDKAKKGPA